MSNDNAPAQAAEHNDLMQLLAKITDKSELIACMILITVGVDGRPMIGTDLGSPEDTLSVLNQVAEAHRYQAVVSKVKVPKDN